MIYICAELAKDLRDLNELLASAGAYFLLTAFKFIFIFYLEIVCIDFKCEKPLLLIYVLRAQILIDAKTSGGFWYVIFINNCVYYFYYHSSFLVGLPSTR